MGIIFNLFMSIALADPTAGWTLEKLHFEIQSPYDLKHSDRYAFDASTDTYHMWVFATDKAECQVKHEAAAHRNVI